MRSGGDQLVSKDKPTLWVVTELYYPEETSTGYYLTRIAEGLAGDFRVRVVCGQPTYSKRGTKAPAHEFHNDVEIFRAGGTTLDKNIIAFKLINMLSLSAAVFLKVLFRFQRGDQVLVVTNPPSMPFICAVAALMKGSGYTLLIHDNYPEILVAAGKASGGSVFVGLLGFFNRWLYKYASRIIVCGRDMFELVTRKTQGLDIPLHTIQNWAELETVRPFARADNRMLSELALSDKFVFLYAGNMGYPNDIESIVECAEKLADDQRFAFVFLGAGVKRKWLETAVGERGLKNVLIVNPRPRSEQNDFLNACDVAVVSLVGKMWGVSVPSRTYNILAAGKPILALTEEGSEVAQVIAEERVGWTVRPGDPDALYSLILQIYEERKEIGDIGVRAREAAIGRYSLETALAKYRDALGVSSAASQTTDD